MKGGRRTFGQYRAWVIDRAYDDFLSIGDQRGHMLPFKSYQEEVGIPGGRSTLCLTSEHFDARIDTALSSNRSQLQTRFQEVFRKLVKHSFGADIEGEEALIRAVAIEAFSSGDHRDN